MPTAIELCGGRGPLKLFVETGAHEVKAAALGPPATSCSQPTPTAPTSQLGLHIYLAG